MTSLFLPSRSPRCWSPVLVSRCPSSRPRPPGEGRRSLISLPGPPSAPGPLQVPAAAWGPTPRYHWGPGPAKVGPIDGPKGPPRPARPQWSGRPHPVSPGRPPPIPPTPQRAAAAAAAQVDRHASLEHEGRTELLYPWPPLSDASTLGAELEYVVIRESSFGQDKYM